MKRFLKLVSFFSSVSEWFAFFFICGAVFWWFAQAVTNVIYPEDASIQHVRLVAIGKEYRAWGLK